MKKMKRRVLSWMLTVTMLLGMGTVPVWAETTGVTAPTVVTSNGRLEIYANGTPITIEAGEKTGYTKIKYSDGSKDVYVDLDPDTAGVQEEADLSNADICGSTQLFGSGTTSTISITMNGGVVGTIYGSSSLLEKCDVDITMNNGIVKDGICGVKRSTNINDVHITIKGGTVNKVSACNIQMYEGCINGTAYMTVDGGTITKMTVGNDINNLYLIINGGSINETTFYSDYQYISGSFSGIFSSETFKETVKNYIDRFGSKGKFLYKTDASNWTVKGNLTLSDDFILNQGQMLTIPEGNSITTNNYKLTNNGVIICYGAVNGVITGLQPVTTIPTVDTEQKRINGNGIPLSIEAGDQDGETKVSFSGMPLSIDGKESADFHEYTIYGGSQTESVQIANITMSGGSVSNIYAGGGENYPVTNKANIEMTGGTVSGTISGGNAVNVSGFVSQVTSLDKGSFGSLLYKKTSTEWMIAGNEYNIQPESTFEVGDNETLTIPSGTTLNIAEALNNSGEVINNGTIIGLVNGKVTGNGKQYVRPMMNNTGDSLFANGVPITITSGREPNTSKVSYMEDGQTCYLKVNDKTDIDLQNIDIYGGSMYMPVKTAAITMRGGVIKGIECGGLDTYDSPAMEVTDKVDVIITGGSISENSKNNISFFNISENAIANIFISTTNEFDVASPSDNKKINIFYNAAGDKPFDIVGNPMIPSGEETTISEGQKVEIPTGSVLTVNGTLKNNGTVLLKGSISESSKGEITGSGSFVTDDFSADDIKIPDFDYTGKALSIRPSFKEPTIMFGKEILPNLDEYTIDYQRKDGNTWKSVSEVKECGTYKVKYTNANKDFESNEFTVNKLKTTLKFQTKTFAKTLGDEAFSNIPDMSVARTVSYTSSNKEVADVDANGKVTLKGVGSAIITAKAAEDDIYKEASDTYSIVVKAPTLPATSYVNVNLYGYHDIQASWKAVNGADGYKVYCRKSTSKNYTYKGSTTGTSMKISNQSNGAKYFVQVVPYKTIHNNNIDGIEKISGSIVTLKKLNKPGVSKQSSKKVKIKWKNIEGETGYQISKSTSSKKTGKIYTIKTSTGKSKVLSVKKKKTYYYKVRTYKTVGTKKIYAPWSSAKPYKLK